MIGDPTAMWNLLTASTASSSKKMSAARKQLEYLKQQEEFTLRRLAAAEEEMSRPMQFGDDDTVFDDTFENGTIIDEASGEVFGFGAM